MQIHKRQFAGLADAWFRLSIAIKNDTEADKEFGWVQEMYVGWMGWGSEGGVAGPGKRCEHGRGAQANAH